MAETKVVDPERSFYESFLPAVRALNKEHGPLYLAVVIQFAEDAEDEWTLLVGSRELYRNRGAGAEAVVQALAVHVPDPMTQKRIRRIGIIGEDDQIFKELAAAIGKRLNGIASIQRTKFSGLEVPKAGIFVATRDISGPEGRNRPKTPTSKRGRRHHPGAK